MVSVQTIRHEYQRKDNYIATLKQRIQELERDQSITNNHLRSAERNLHEFRGLKENYQMLQIKFEQSSKNYEDKISMYIYILCITVIKFLLII